MVDINNENNKTADSKNIFDDFEDDAGLIDEVNSIKKKKNKDLFFYFEKLWGALQNIFWSGFIIILLMSLYIHIQNDTQLSNSNLLDPFCPIILWDINDPEYSYCSSVSYLENTYTSKLSKLKVEQTESILDILVDLYSFENFTKSKDVLFLLYKTENKLSVLWVLEKFDDLKNEFNNLDKEKIQCNNISIDWEESVLSMSCIAYSAWFERGLRWFDGTDDITLKWTSVSIANSFLNFIDKKSDIFNILNRQKIFNSSNALWDDTDFTNQTSFSLNLKYNLK